MISSRHSLGTPVQLVRRIIFILRRWIAPAKYRPERRYMRGGR
jgi:hypothetical protein